MHKKRYVELAMFGCLRCERYLFAPRSYELGLDVAVCGCNASRYKTTRVRPPRHVQAYWDAQFVRSHSSYRKRLKRYTLSSVRAEPHRDVFVHPLRKAITVFETRIKNVKEASYASRAAVRKKVDVIGLLRSLTAA